MEMNNQMPMGIGGFIPEKNEYNIPEGNNILKYFINFFLVIYNIIIKTY